MGVWSPLKPGWPMTPERFREARWGVLPCAGSDHSPILVDLPVRSDPVRRQGAGRHESGRVEGLERGHGGVLVRERPGLGELFGEGSLTMPRLRYTHS